MDSPISAGWSKTKANIKTGTPISTNGLRSTLYILKIQPSIPWGFKTLLLGQSRVEPAKPTLTARTNPENAMRNQKSLGGGS